MRVVASSSGVQTLTIETGSKRLVVERLQELDAYQLAVAVAAEIEDVHLEQHAAVVFDGGPHTKAGDGRQRVVGQAVLGGVTVLLGLNPGIVAAHFLVSMGLVAASSYLWFARHEDAVAHRERRLFRIA